MARRPWIVTTHDAIEIVDDNMWCIEGDMPDVPGAAPMRRRMTVIKKRDGSLWFWNALPVDDDTLARIRAWGRPHALLLPNGHHAIDADAFARRLELRVLAPRASHERLRARVDVGGDLSEAHDDELRILPLGGVKSGEAIASFGATMLFGDVVQNNRRPRGPKGLVAQLAGFVGGPKVPPVFKLAFVDDKKALRRSLDDIAARCAPAVLVPSHGDVVRTEAASVLARALAAL